MALDRSLVLVRRRMSISLRIVMDWPTNYFAISHPSLPNYVALTSGSTQGVGDDNGPSSHPLNVPSIFSQLPGGQSRSLQESMPSNCLKSDSGQYVLHHNPMAYYTNLGSDCANFDVGFGASPDLSAAFTFITPNAVHDMLDGTIAQGDAFLSSYVPALMATPQYQAGNTAIFITWDEDENSGGSNKVADDRGLAVHRRGHGRDLLQPLFAASYGGGSSWLAGAWQCRLRVADGERVRAYRQSSAASFAAGEYGAPGRVGRRAAGAAADRV